MTNQLFKIVYLITFVVLTIIVWELIRHGYEDYSSVMHLVLLSIGSVLWFVNAHEIVSWYTVREMTQLDSDPRHWEMD